MPSEPTGWKEALSRIDRARAALDALPTVCAEAYATTKWKARPIIDRHFTAGNDARYGWPALAASTLAQKEGGAEASNVTAKQIGWVATRAQASLGAGVLPMLVRSGGLRNAILTSARIAKTGPESVMITWTVPDFAHWHVTGGNKAGRPPKRDFRKPNSDDLADVREVGQNFINQAIGDGRTSFNLSI